MSGRPHCGGVCQECASECEDFRGEGDKLFALLFREIDRGLLEVPPEYERSVVGLITKRLQYGWVGEYRF